MTTLHAVAGYLPGLKAADVQWQPLVFESGATRLEVLVPVLSQDQMTALALRVKQASRVHLKTMTVSQIVAVIDRAIARAELCFDTQLCMQLRCTSNPVQNRVTFCRHRSPQIATAALGTPKTLIAPTCLCQKAAPLGVPAC